MIFAVELHARARGGNIAAKKNHELHVCVMNYDDWPTLSRITNTRQGKELGFERRERICIHAWCC